MPDRAEVPGSTWEDHVVPPSDVETTVPPPGPYPTARQFVAVGHETPDSPVIPAGALIRNHDAAPLLVMLMTPPDDPVPTAMQESPVHETAFNVATPLGTVTVSQLQPLSRVLRKVATFEFACAPDATHTPMAGQSMP